MTNVTWIKRSLSTHYRTIEYIYNVDYKQAIIIMITKAGKCNMCMYHVNTIHKNICVASRCLFTFTTRFTFTYILYIYSIQNASFNIKFYISTVCKDRKFKTSAMTGHAWLTKIFIQHKRDNLCEPLVYFHIIKMVI
jgi:hypothetical protein